MRHRLLRTLSFAPRPQPPAQERAEPRLMPADPPLPFRRSAPPDPGVLSFARDNARSSATAPIIAVSDPRPEVPLQQEPGSLRLIAFAGCVLFVVAGIGSAAFLLSANPGQERTGAAAPSNPATPQTGRIADPVSVGPAERHAAEAVTAPSPPSTLPQPAANDAALQSPSGLPLGSSPPTQTLQPAARKVPAEPPNRTSPATAAVIADRPAAAVTNIPDHGATSAPAQPSHHSNARPAERRAHLRAARETQTSSAQPSPDRLAAPQRHVRSIRRGGGGAPHQADQAAAFDELLAHLTGSAKPADRPPKQVLTPPAAGALDPFAARPDQ